MGNNDTHTRLISPATEITIDVYRNLQGHGSVFIIVPPLIVFVIINPESSPLS